MEKLLVQVRIGTSLSVKQYLRKEFICKSVLKIWFKLVSAFEHILLLFIGIYSLKEPTYLNGKWQLLSMYTM